MSKTNKDSDSKSFTRNKSKKIQMIKEATRYLIQKNGYEDTTNHGIAKNAEVSVGLVYKYFPRGKLDILKSLMEDEADEYHALQTKRFNLDLINQINWQEKVQSLIELVIKRHREKLEFIKAMEIAMLSSPEVFINSRALAQELITMLPIIKKLETIGVIQQEFSNEEIKRNMLILDILCHQHLFYNNVPLKPEENFKDFFFQMLKILFKIE